MQQNNKRRRPARLRAHANRVPRTPEDSGKLRSPSPAACARLNQQPAATCRRDSEHSGPGRGPVSTPESREKLGLRARSRIIAPRSPPLPHAVTGLPSPPSSGPQFLPRKCRRGRGLARPRGDGALWCRCGVLLLLHASGVIDGTPSPKGQGRPDGAAEASLAPRRAPSAQGGHPAAAPAPPLGAPTFPTPSTGMEPRTALPPSYVPTFSFLRQPH